MIVWVKCVVVIILVGLVMEDLVCRVFPSTTTAAGAIRVATVLLLFIKLIVRVGRKGVFGLVIFIGKRERMGYIMRRSSSWKGAIAAVVEQILNGDSACGNE